MAEPNVDIAIVGGGIHGVGVAQAAAAAGYEVCLLERSELAAGTSSRSSKLIHGGLRYLETGQLGLVHESVRERQLLLKLAPDIVRPLPFHFPIYRSSTRRPWQIRSGLLLYSLFAGISKYALFGTVPRREWETLEGLTTDELQQVFYYWDAQADDAILTGAVMRSAQSLGAELLCPAEVLRADRTENGYTLTCLLSDHHGHSREEKLRCRALVNAAGPWANRLLARVHPHPTSLPMDLVQGTHIIVPGSLHGKVFYLESPSDRRTVFTIPWYGDTLIGTTEHLYEGHPDEVQPLREEIDYLLEALRFYFPGRDETVLSSFAGLRVLPRSGRRLFNRPRETTLHCDDDALPRLTTIYGGKLTGYRATAQAVIQRLQPLLGERKRQALTSNLPLHKEVSSPHAAD